MQKNLIKLDDGEFQSLDQLSRIKVREADTIYVVKGAKSARVESFIKINRDKVKIIKR